MPRFEGFIYGNVPVEGECTTDGEIIDIMVPGLRNKNGHPVFLDFDENKRVELQAELQRPISDAINDWYRQVRQEKKHGRRD